MICGGIIDDFSHLTDAAGDKDRPEDNDGVF